MHLRLIFIGMVEWLGLIAGKSKRKLEIGCIFRYISTTRAHTTKWRAVLDSAWKIGLTTLLNDILMIVKSIALLGYTNSEVIHIYIYISTTNDAVVKRIPPAESLHWIGIFIHLNDVLIVVGSASSEDLKIQRSEESVTSPFISLQPVVVWLNGCQHLIRRVE